MTLSTVILNGGRKRVASWTAETTAGNSAIVAHEFDVPAVVGTLQVAGTFGSATVTFVGSNDGSNFVALTDVRGVAISFTAAGLAEISTGVRHVKPSISGGTGDSINATLVYWCD